MVEDRVLRLRMELFVDDLDTSVAFYADMLGFVVLRRSDGYVSLRRGAAVLGLGPVDRLPDRDDGPGFSQQRLAIGNGAGVEIVLELDTVEPASEVVQVWFRRRFPSSRRPNHRVSAKPSRARSAMPAEPATSGRG